VTDLVLDNFRSVEKMARLAQGKVGVTAGTAP
jgi:hypothetical protein